MKVLGIETSCDETAAAVVEIRNDGQLKLLSSVVASSMDLHAAYGGVVPEIAARSHIEHMTPVIEGALRQTFDSDELQATSDEQTTQDSRLKTQDWYWDQIDAIAVTQGPGLGGSLLVGVTAARTLALVKKKPLYAINHVMAHPFAAFITSGIEGIKYPSEAPDFPMLSLIVSGGHSQLVLFKSHFEYKVLGRTRDDAIGEAFDKVAKILGLPYPGGPSIGKKAAEGDVAAHSFPDAKLDTPYDFSFSGLKTAVLRAAQAEIGKDHSFPSTKLAELLSDTQKANIAASFQQTALSTLVSKTALACNEFKPKSLVVAGGVAASPTLRQMLREKLEIEAVYPDMKLCTDNGAMIAALGCFMHHTDQKPADPYGLETSPSLSM